tara:strand:+ start:3554 stop:3736 length:183 start_codon:yes stop_codon:yes gene_type:complete
MKIKVINEHKFSRTIADLFIESEDARNPHPEHNAYNCGLIDAERALNGVSVDVIKETRPK